jgi:transcriptional regulator, araC-type
MKTITHNSYIQSINKASHYIATHLDETIDVKTLARVANLSDFHFCRIFKAIKGEPPIAFIARLRIETAAQLLRYSSLAVEEIAYNIGYESPASLSKAFKSRYGITPTQYRTDKNRYIMKGETINENLALKAPKLVTLEDKSLIYVSLMGEYGSLNYDDAYQRLWRVVKEQKLFTKGIETLCISHDDPKVTEANQQRSDVCLAIHKPAKPQDGVSCKTLAGGKYAMFAYQGPYDNLAAVYDSAMRWLVNSEYELRDEPMFEKYLNNCQRTSAEKLKTEVYIPIR